MRFIDYEYAGYNYQAFDIGNHFNEFAGEKGITIWPVSKIIFLMMDGQIQGMTEWGFFTWGRAGGEEEARHLLSAEYPSLRKTQPVL